MHVAGKVTPCVPGSQSPAALVHALTLFVLSLQMCFSVELKMAMAWMIAIRLSLSLKWRWGFSVELFR
jgi:hypothetical protein